MRSAHLHVRTATYACRQLNAAQPTASTTFGYVLMGFLPDFRYALYVAPVWVAILYGAYRIKTSAALRSQVSG